MPRRSKAEADPDVEKRVTRRSLRSSTQSESPASSPSKAKDAPGPASKSKTPKKPSVKDEELPDVEEEGGEEETQTPSKSGGRGRGRPKGAGKKRKRPDSDEDNFEEKDEEDSPAKSRRKRASTSPKSADTSPRRQSSRGAAKIAAAAIEQQAVKDEAGYDEEPGEDEIVAEKPSTSQSPGKGRGRKRKIDSAEETEEDADKKQKLEDDQAEESADTKAAEATSDQPDEDKEEQPKAEETSAKPDAQGEAKPEKSEEKEEKEETDQEKTEPEAITTQEEAGKDVEDKDQTLMAINNNTSPEKSKEFSSRLSPKKRQFRQNEDPLMTRSFLTNKDCEKSAKIKRQFSVVSYNILADCKSLRQKTERGWYKNVDISALPISKRHARLLDELLYLDADIFCLQEVGQEYYKKLKTCMERHGYKGFFVKRSSSKNYNDDGEACFIRISQFAVEKHSNSVVHELAIKEMQTNGVLPSVRQSLGENIKGETILMILHLRHLQTNCKIVVANTHMTWGADMTRYDHQCVQIGTCIRELLNQAGDLGQPYIMCGDFSSTPDTPGYQILQDGYPSDQTLEKLQQIEDVSHEDSKTSLVNLWWRGFQHASSTLRSSYKVSQGLEPVTSCFPHDHRCRAVDYIWYSHTTCDLLGVLETLPEQLMKPGMPNSVCPSDHLSLKAMFQFK